MSDNNGNIAAVIAALGSTASASDDDTYTNTNSNNTLNANLDNIGNDNSDNSDHSDNSLDNVGNDNSDNSDHSDNSLDNVGNDNSDNSDDDVLTNVGNDNSDNSSDDDVTVDVTLDNIGNDNSDNSQSNVGNDYSDNSLDNVGNDNSDNSVNVDVSIADSFNTDVCDSDWLDLEDVQFDVVSLISSDGQAFSLTQVSELADGDYLGSANVTSNSGWSQGADATGGAANGINSSGDGDFGSTGEDGVLHGTADATGAAHLEAFNQSISMGANIQQNVINLNVVGSDQFSDDNA